MMNLSSEEVKSLKKVIEYVLDSEAESFEIYIQEGGEEERHVYYHANMMQHILNLKGELPEVKLTGDITLDKFNK